jgi:hypothetical protein
MTRNRDVPPFDNPDLRQAMALSLDRAAFINIITEGHGDIGGAMQSPPEGLWGMPPEMLKTLPGYNPDVQNNRAEARQLMRKLGYGPANRLKIKVSVRDLPFLRDGKMSHHVARPANRACGSDRPTRSKGAVIWLRASFPRLLRSTGYRSAEFRWQQVSRARTSGAFPGPVMNGMHTPLAISPRNTSRLRPSSVAC